MEQRILCPIQTISLSKPDTIALISNHGTLTYRQLHEKIQKTQLQYKAQGLRRGSRIVLIDKNSFEFIISLFALWRLGAVACLLSPRSPHKEIKQQINELKCKFLITDLTKTAVTLSLNQKSGVINSEWKLSLKSPATIMLTSGSCGHPKAVVHTIGNHYFNALGSNENIPVKHKDCWLLSLPLYHVSGLSILWRCFLVGATIALSDPADQLPHAIRKFKTTHISLVPTQLIRFLKHRAAKNTFQKLKAILLGGGPISDQLIATAQKLKLPIFLTYGLTEMASQVATSNPLRNKKIEVLKYRQLKITASREIAVRGQTLFKGYLKSGRIIRSTDKKGWFYTGDLGKIDDQKGLLVLGRKDNLFISGGENIYPEEIEKALLDTKLIEQVVVIPRADTTFGFRPIAFVKMPNAQKIVASKLKHQLAKTLAAFKIPDNFYNFPVGYKQKGIKPNRQQLMVLIKKK
jgi:O-succinylbenzoic acid--CoA ligase